jgi:hypothetical protein
MALKLFAVHAVIIEGWAVKGTPLQQSRDAKATPVAADVCQCLKIRG